MKHYTSDRYCYYDASYSCEWCGWNGGCANIDQWWLVARLERYEAARFDEETAQQMTMELFQEWINEEVLCMLARL